MPAKSKPILKGPWTAPGRLGSGAAGAGGSFSVSTAARGSSLVGVWEGGAGSAPSVFAAADLLLGAKMEARVIVFGSVMPRFLIPLAHLSMAQTNHTLPNVCEIRCSKYYKSQDFTFRGTSDFQ